MGVLSCACAAVVYGAACGTVSAANASAPHPHQGFVTRLDLEKPNIKLSSDDLDKIEKGLLWTDSFESNGVGRGIGIRDIEAPLDIVWEQISDLKGYVGKVPMLKSLQVYLHEDRESEVIQKAAYTVKAAPGYYYQYFVEHHSMKDKGVMLFFLDYERSSDFSDLQGKWYLEGHPTKPGVTRVYYQCDLQLFGYVPSMVKRFLTSQGLVSAIGWVKKESERSAPGVRYASVEAAPAFLDAVSLKSEAITNIRRNSYIPSHSLVLATIAGLCAGVAAASKKLGSQPRLGRRCAIIVW